MNQKALRVAVAFGISIIGTGAARAAQIVQTFDVALSTLEITSANGDGTFNYFLSSGAPAGSILTGVELEISTDVQLDSLSVKNTAAQGQSFEYKTYEDFLVDSSTLPSGDGSNLLSGLEANGGGVYGAIDLFIQKTPVFYNSQQTINWVVSNSPITGSSDTGLLESVNVGAYDRTGTFTLGFETLTTETFSGGGGNTQATQVTKGDGTVTVIYDYIPGDSSAPEPASIAMIGAALIGLSLFARRKVQNR